MWVDDSEQEPLTGGGVVGLWRRKKGLILIALFVAWNLLLFLLAVIALSKEGKVENNQYNTVSYQLEAELSYLGDDAPSEFAVSLLEDGTLSLGGGSTIYQNLVNMHDLAGNGSSISSLTTLRLGQTRFLMAYQISGAKNMCYLVVATINSDDMKVNFADPVSVGICSLNLISLTSELYIGSRYGNFFLFTITDKDVITPGANATFSFMGADTLIAPLSNSTFAITYYTGTANTLNTAVARVYNNTITLLNGIVYSPDRNTHSLIALSDSTYMDCYPLDNGNIQCSQFSFDGTSITLIAQNTFKASNTSLFFGLAALSSTQAALVWIDQGSSSNNRLMAAVIEIQGFNIVYGASMILNSGDASGVMSDSYYPQIIVQAFSSTQFMVLYSDFANQGKVTLTTVDLNEDDMLSSPTTSFSTVALSSPLNTYEEGYYWLAMTIQTPNQFLIFDSFSAGNITLGGIHFGEVLNRAIGITSAKKANQVVDVTVGGIVTLEHTKLVPGMTYYTTTQGVLVKGPPFGSSQVTSQGYLQSGNMLISANSCLGIALDKESLLLHTCF
eukprot:TRINITY_DN2950_c0_g5_i1.p1 TRINITY_DN2950_c0_g5~~TRINITY_DN2950_c0_g5_i1.p1  ORF type:complete len:558 (-),score=132.97 TRINITY_DN2950_c0_g5_i1:865-2538(-)